MAGLRVRANNRSCNGMGRSPSRSLIMTWETPAYCEIRLGFEVTAYVYVR